MVASFTAMTNRLFLRRATLFLLASTTVAVAATPAAELELYPNFNALSVYVHGVEAERATVEYRRAGSSEWLPAHDLARITNETSLELGAAPLSGSLFYLQPALRAARDARGWDADARRRDHT